MAPGACAHSSTEFAPHRFLSSNLLGERWPIRLLHGEHMVSLIPSVVFVEGACANRVSSNSYDAAWLTCRRLVLSSGLRLTRVACAFGRT